MLWYSTVIAVGLVALVWSADRFVDGASAIAKRAGLTPMLIGLTIVSVGTSAPEILISIMSALADSGELAVGNALGSNIANVGLVLGVTLLFSSIKLGRDTTWVDLPLLMLVVLVTWFLLYDLELSRSDSFRSTHRFFQWRAEKRVECVLHAAGLAARPLFAQREKCSPR